MSAQPQPAVAEQILAIRKAPSGNGQQYEVRWRGSTEPKWVAASVFRRQHAALVQAFEQQQQQQQRQQQQQQQQLDENTQAAEGEATAADGSSMRAQFEAMRQLVLDQQQQMRAQQEQLQQLRASPTHAPQLGAQASVQLQPLQQLGAPAGPSASQPASRFARKEQRAQDLREYDGAPAAKLEEWLQELARVVRLYQLNDREAVDFGVSRLTGAALQWSLTLNATQQAALRDAAALGAALRARFQPITAARAAPEQLRALRQGSRPVNDYIAEFQRLRALLPSMSEDDALFAFETGLSRDIALELRIQRVQTVADAVSLAAHVGGVGAAAHTPAALYGRAAAAANQMDMGDEDGAAALEDRIARSILNALQSQGAGGTSGLGAKTQTQRGYEEERKGGSRGGRGAARGRGARFGGGGGGGITYNIPGVPAAVVEQRRAAGQCLRCGSGDHRGMECPNAPSASQLN